MSYLGIKTSYSFLESTITISGLCKKMKDAGYRYVIIGDRNLNGSLRFFKAAKKYQLKAILGQTIPLSLEALDILVYVTVKDERGYKNILKLNQVMLNESLSLNQFVLYQEGLAVTLSIQNQDLLSVYNNQNISHVYDVIDSLKNNIHDFYVSYSLDNSLFEEMSKDVYQAYHEKIPFVVEHQTRYLQPQDRIHYSDLCRIKGINPLDGDLSLLSKKAFQKLSRGLIEIQQKFLKSHQFDLTLPAFNMPSIPLKEDVNEKDYLVSLARVGLQKRLKQSNSSTHIDIYSERLQYELDVISKMGYEAYFLIVYDIIKYAKKQDILVGPGRGSAAGSLVSYCLGITDVDPIEYDLLFERFLNPERISMPDIDMDFPDDKRDQVITFAHQRFGSNHIASINTYQTFALKSALRDISKVMGLDAKRTAYLSQHIMNQNIDSLDQEMKSLKHRAEAIIGLPRQTGTHAAGIIFSKEPLHQYIPLQQGPYDFYQTQYEASELESLGLLKMDFLGLRNLSIIAQTVSFIKKSKPFNLLKIPKNDKKTYELLSQAKTQGVFQLESQGMRRVLKKLKPSNFEDLIALLALYRPGPMAFIDTYVERRHGKSYEPLHPLLKDILASTYGIIIYQEQIMKIAQIFAGYSLADADLLRRGISKKDEHILLSEKARFIKKSMEKGHSKNDATQLYDLIVKFSDYGFNRSHSVSYAFVAYQMAYLKVNYPAPFIVSLLNSVIGDEKHTYEYIKELKQFGIKVLKPDINKSVDTYVLSGDQVLCPFSIIKSFGKKTVEEIVSERQDKLFRSFDDFKKRLHKKINRNHIEKLIDAGAFDSFEHNRHTMHQNANLDMIDYQMYVHDFSYQVVEEYDFDTLMQKERDALGFNLVYDIKAYLKPFNMSEVSDLEIKNEVWIAAHVLKVKTIQTKKGDEMAFVEMTDGSDTFEATLFPNVYNHIKPLYEKKFYKVLVKNNTYQGKKSFVIEKMTHLK